MDSIKGKEREKRSSQKRIKSQKKNYYLYGCARGVPAAAAELVEAAVAGEDEESHLDVAED